MGRPTKYTEERVAAICKAIENGNTFRVAALINGIDETTFHDWRKKFSEFSQRTSEAEAKAEENVVRNLNHQIHSGDINAIKFYLTHRNNDGWRPPKERQEITGAGGGPLIVERVSYGKGE